MHFQIIKLLIMYTLVVQDIFLVQMLINILVKVYFSMNYYVTM